MVYMHNEILFGHENNEILPFWSSMDRPWYHSKWGKLDKDEYYVVLLTCRI